jgi:RimJ/RimL family protein N-acetyltransferase
VELGWRLAREVWGRGLATEGASECLRYAFGPLALSAVCSIHVPDNVVSRRVMEKLGMHFDRDTGTPRQRRSCTRLQDHRTEMGEAESSHRAQRLSGTVAIKEE